MTLEGFIFKLCEGHPWRACWFRLGEVIVSAGGKAWATKRAMHDPCPRDIEAIGCRGVNVRGLHDWVGWDLDVGHGHPAKQYGSTIVAIHAGRMIRQRAGPQTEIRLSKSGTGVHVRQLLNEPITTEQAQRHAKAIVDDLGLKADPTALSRQAFWLWCREPKPDSFKLIEAATFN